MLCRLSVGEAVSPRKIISLDSPPERIRRGQSGAHGQGVFLLFGG
jgi:hypothetical protein